MAAPKCQPSEKMAINHIVGVVYETPYMKHHECIWFWFDVAAILPLTDEGYGLKKTVVSSYDLCWGVPPAFC